MAEEQSTETTAEAVAEMLAESGEYYLEAMAAAYLRETRIPVHEVVLCHTVTDQGYDVWWFTTADQLEGLDGVVGR